MTRGDLQAWVAAYERAWRTPGVAGLAELFAADATYSTGPYEAPHRGLEAISRMWEAERRYADEEFTLASEVVAVERDTGVVRVDVHYGEGETREYCDLWIVRCDAEGRCRAFEEWPFWPADVDGRVAAGPPA